MNNTQKNQKKIFTARFSNKLRLHVGTRCYLTAYLNSALLAFEMLKQKFFLLVGGLSKTFTVFANLCQQQLVTKAHCVKSQPFIYLPTFVPLFAYYFPSLYDFSDISSNTKGKNGEISNFMITFMYPSKNLHPYIGHVKKNHPRSDP